jgi:hypothetical protein
LIANATRAVNVQREDGARALKMMEDMGVFIERQELRDKAA